MALQITEFRGVFSIYGKLNMSNFGICKKHMHRFIAPEKRIVLNLERTEQIDLYAARGLEQLYRNAQKMNCCLLILEEKMKTLFR